jgi:transcriptional regulator GlxA family with amidase domain
MRRIIILLYPRVQALDVVGPAEVFNTAESLSHGHYRVILASPRGGLIETTSAVLQSKSIRHLKVGANDTLLVAGGAESALGPAMADVALGRWLKSATVKAERFGSICSGAFVLANLGVLDGCRVATHWSGAARLKSFRPALQVDADSIYVHDTAWTSAGVTAGIDMALAMVAADCGESLAAKVAAQLVLFQHRPGFQSQFSEVLVAQQEQASPLAQVLNWARANLRQASVETLAARAGVSDRTFLRLTVKALNLTPSRLIQKLRVEAARTQLVSTPRLSKTIAYACGFSSQDQMATAFRKELGMLPRELRMLHQRDAGKAR